MAIFTIDGARIGSREDFWSEYVSVVRPEGAETFGRNLDALNDALWGGPGFPGEDFVLRITGSEAMAFAVGPEFVKQLRSIFGDSQSATLELL